MDDTLHSKYFHGLPPVAGNATGHFERRVVREGGFEPPHRQVLDPKSSASASSAILAPGIIIHRLSNKKTRGKEQVIVMVIVLDLILIPGTSPNAR